MVVKISKVILNIIKIHSCILSREFFIYPEMLSRYKTFILKLWVVVQSNRFKKGHKFVMIIISPIYTKFVFAVQVYELFHADINLLNYHSCFAIIIDNSE